MICMPIYFSMHIFYANLCLKNMYIDSKGIKVSLTIRPAYILRISIFTYLEGFLCCQSKHNLLFFIPYINPDNRSCSIVTVPLQVKCREFNVIRLEAGWPYAKPVSEYRKSIRTKFLITKCRYNFVELTLNYK